MHIQDKEGYYSGTWQPLWPKHCPWFRFSTRRWIVGNEAETPLRKGEIEDLQNSVVFPTACSQLREDNRVAQRLFWDKELSANARSLRALNPIDFWSSFRHTLSGQDFTPQQQLVLPEKAGNYAPKPKTLPVNRHPCPPHKLLPLAIHCFGFLSKLVLRLLGTQPAKPPMDSPVLRNTGGTRAFSLPIPSSWIKTWEYRGKLLSNKTSATVPSDELKNCFFANQLPGDLCYFYPRKMQLKSLPPSLPSQNRRKL